MVISIAITKPEGGLNDGEPVMTMTFDVEGKIIGPKKELAKIQNVEIALIEEQPLTGELPLRDPETGDPREGSRTAFNPANPAKPGDWSTFSGTVCAPDINYRTIEVRATMSDGTFETAQKQIRHAVYVGWNPPCGCRLLLAFCEVAAKRKGKPTAHLETDPEIFKGVADEFEIPGSGGRRYLRTAHCGGHKGVRRNKIRDVVQSEVDVMVHAQQKFDELNPDAKEKFRTPQGDVEIYRGNIQPLVIEWTGKDENRVAKISIHPDFDLPSARTKTKAAAMRKHLADKVGDKAEFLEG